MQLVPFHPWSKKNGSQPWLCVVITWGNLKILMSGSSHPRFWFNWSKVWFGHQQTARPPQVTLSAAKLRTTILGLGAHQKHLEELLKAHLCHPLTQLLISLCCNSSAGGRRHLCLKKKKNPEVMLTVFRVENLCYRWKRVSFFVSFLFLFCTLRTDPYTRIYRASLLD